MDNYNTSIIRDNRSEIVGYDDPDFPIMLRHNYIPSYVELSAANVHWHDDIEIIYLTEGKISQRVDDKTILLHPGEAMLINARHLHALASENTDSTIYCVIFHPRLLSASNSIFEKYVKKLTENDQIPYILFNDSVGWQKDLLDCIVSMYESRHMDTPELCFLEQLFRFWSILIPHLETSKNEESHHDDIHMQAFKKMILYIDDHYYEKITLKDLCRVGEIGSTTCSLIFHRYVSCTPMEYLQNHRLSKAAHLLFNTNMNITEIALACGFTSSSYFTESFRKVTGFTPSQYRKVEPEFRTPNADTSV